MKYCVVFATAANAKEAKLLSHILLKEKLAACVSCVDKIKSSYWWKGNIERSNETLLMIKTEKRVIKTLIKKIKENHTYSVPEIIALSIAEGNPDYFNWITSSLRGGIKK